MLWSMMIISKTLIKDADEDDNADSTDGRLDGDGVKPLLSKHTPCIVWRTNVPSTLPAATL